MASLGSGVELRAKAIRIQFSLTGEAVRRTLKREHRALALTPEKLAVLQELGGWASLAMVQRNAHLAVSHVAAWAGNIGGSGTTAVQVPLRQPVPDVTAAPKGAAGLRGCVGVADGTRTHDDQNHNLGLYQLSYSHHRNREL